MAFSFVRPIDRDEKVGGMHFTKGLQNTLRSEIVSYSKLTFVEGQA